MSGWLRRLRGAIGMGLLWGLAWGLVGGAIELIWNLWPGFPLGPLVDMWPQTLALAGFIGGFLFALVLGLTEHHRSFEELSARRFSVWGAVAGVLLSGVVIMIGQPSHWLHGLVAGGALTALSTATAAISLPLARSIERRALKAP